MARRTLHPSTAAALALAGLLTQVGCEEGSTQERGADAAAVARAAQPIVGGVAEPGRPAVVALVAPTPDGDVLICSGVLITPEIVVTAAHCRHPHVTGFDADELVVSFGSDIAAKSVRIDVELGAYHPQYRPNEEEAGRDIGAIRLAQPAPVDPIPIGPGPTQGEEVVIVGFGTRAGSGEGSAMSGAKRSGTAIVSAVDDSWFKVDRGPATTCAGDSGGATLSRASGSDALLGIHSRGDCQTAVWNERLDAHADGFLRSFLGDYGGCDADQACALGCPDPDPDCPCAADDKCNETCGDDPDCDDFDEQACEGEACESPRTAPHGGWGGAGCGVGALTARASAYPVSGLALPGALGILGLLSLRAFRRRAARGGSSRSGS